MYLHYKDDNLLEMAEIGRIDGYKILVYGSEGPIPHFHVENSEKHIHSCVKILEDSYFEHSLYRDKLNLKMVKKLKTFLDEPHKFFGKHGYTNWQIICIYWNDSNPNYTITEDVEQLKRPAYDNL